MHPYGHFVKHLQPSTHRQVLWLVLSTFLLQLGIQQKKLLAAWQSTYSSIEKITRVRDTVRQAFDARLPETLIIWICLNSTLKETFKVFLVFIMHLVHIKLYSTSKYSFCATPSYSSIQRQVAHAQVNYCRCSKMCSYSLQMRNLSSSATHSPSNSRILASYVTGEPLGSATSASPNHSSFVHHIRIFLKGLSTCT